MVIINFLFYFCGIKVFITTLMKEIELKSTIFLAQYEELDTQDAELVNLAKEATQRAYAPYSHFHVGAALRLKNGQIITGNNQENAAYTNGICAERNAIFAAQNLYPNQAIMSIAIAAYSEEEFTAAPVSPCGACRQVMIEIESRYKQPIRILLYGEKGTYIIPEGIKTLMPPQFDTNALYDA